jgi:4-diphosphocytidyl-2-C-methyl-D-erythritol kinase
VKLRALAPGKVNLCLFLGGTRDDGRHELVTLFESVSLADELVLSTLGAGADSDEVVCPRVHGPNLVSAALQGLRELGWDSPAVRIEIHKRVPVAGGMAGGSADAAAALRLAVEIAPGRPEEVATLADSLGSDVPSQLAPGLVLGTGAGEIIEPVLPLALHALLVLPQPQALSTADVYREADRLGLTREAEALRSKHEELLAALRPGARLPAELVINDLEPAAVSLCPAIGEALEAARAAGADHALVCGSGPTVVGLYWGDGASSVAAEAAAALVSRFPGAVAVEAVDSAFGSPIAL